MQWNGLKKEGCILVKDEHLAENINICAIISFHCFQNSGSVVTVAAFQQTCGQPLLRALESFVYRTVRVIVLGLISYAVLRGCYHWFLEIQTTCTHACMAASFHPLWLQTAVSDTLFLLLSDSYACDDIVEAMNEINKNKEYVNDRFPR